jgi:hypothetical protein
MSSPLQQQFDKEEKSPFRFTRVVLGIPTKHASQKAVLIALAIRTNSKTCTCRPSYDRLMKDTGLSRYAISAALKYLRDTLKVLTWKQGHSNQFMKPMANLYLLDYRAMAALKESAESDAESDLESAESDSGVAESDCLVAESDSGVAEYAELTPTAQVTTASSLQLSQDYDVRGAALKSGDLDQRQDQVRVASKSEALSLPSELSEPSLPIRLSKPAYDIPSFVEYDATDRRWVTRRNLGRGTTPAEIAELQRLNRERIKPPSIQ